MKAKKFSDLTLNGIIAFEDAVNTLNARTQDFEEISNEYWERFTFDCGEAEAAILQRMLGSMDTTAADILREAKVIVSILEG